MYVCGVVCVCMSVWFAYVCGGVFVGVVCVWCVCGCVIVCVYVCGWVRVCVVGVFVCGICVCVL